MQKRFPFKTACVHSLVVVTGILLVVLAIFALGYVLSVANAWIGFGLLTVVMFFIVAGAIYVIENDL